MSRFVPSLFIAATAFVPNCNALQYDQWGAIYNFRSGGQYSTKSSSKTELTFPGVKFFISPGDSFDFVPSSGFSTRLEELEQNPLFLASPEEQAIVRGSDEDLAKWATSRLDHDHSTSSLQKHIAPRPNESLPGKVLTVDSEKFVVRAEHTAVICHALDQDAHLCHKLHKPMDITEVTVSPNGKPSKVWVACHYGEVDDGETICHVMNVGDLMFTTIDLGGRPAEYTTAKKLLRQKSNNE